MREVVIPLYLPADVQDRNAYQHVGEGEEPA